MKYDAFWFVRGLVIPQYKRYGMKKTGMLRGHVLATVTFVVCYCIVLGVI